MATFNQILEMLQEENIPRDPSKDKVIKKGKEYEILETEPYGPDGKYKDFIIKFKAGAPNIIKASKEEAIEYVKKQEYV